eukprot:9900095-Prorocentrum_lima.AAC.1
MTSSLVGSEMCIRDRALLLAQLAFARRQWLKAGLAREPDADPTARGIYCLLYTSDAADDM